MLVKHEVKPKESNSSLGLGASSQEEDNEEEMINL